MGRIIVKVAGRKYHRIYPFWVKFLNQLNSVSHEQSANQAKLV